jgi:hypothetical protein
MKPRAQSLIKIRSRLQTENLPVRKRPPTLNVGLKYQRELNNQVKSFNFLQNSNQKNSEKVGAKLNSRQFKKLEDFKGLEQNFSFKFRGRASRDQDRHLENEIKEDKKQKVNRNRFNLQYLKKHWVKSSCNLSILDFWTNEMLANASKLIHKNRVPKVKEENRFEFLRQKTPFSKTQVIRKKMSFADFGDYLEKIEKICNKTNQDTLKLKTKINETLTVLNNPNSFS